MFVAAADSCRTLWVMTTDGSGKGQHADDVSPQAELVWMPQSGSMAVYLASSGLCREP